MLLVVKTWAIHGTTSVQMQNTAAKLEISKPNNDGLHLIIENKQFTFNTINSVLQIY